MAFSRADFPSDDLNTRREVIGAERVDVDDWEDEFDSGSVKDDLGVFNANVSRDDEVGDDDDDDDEWVGDDVKV